MRAGRPHGRRAQDPGCQALLRHTTPPGPLSHAVQGPGRLSPNRPASLSEEDSTGHSTRQ